MMVAGVLLFCALFGSALVIAGAGKSTNEQVRRAPQSTPTSIGIFLDDLARQNAMGHIVFFNDVRLEPGPTQQVMLAHDSAGKTLLVVSEAATVQKSAGAVADVMGVVAPLPSAATMRKSWKFSKQQVEELRKNPVYIDATMVHKER